MKGLIQQSNYKYKGLRILSAGINLFNGTFFTSTLGGSLTTTQIADMSLNGKYILLGRRDASPTKFYLSTDYGSNFNRILTTEVGSNYSAPHVIVSYDGSYMYCYTGGDSTGRIWLSTNSGTSWSEVQPLGTGANGWLDGCISKSDPKYHAFSAGGNFPSYFYFSSNYGLSFSALTGVTSTYAAGSSSVMSKTGQYIYLSRSYNAGKSYISNDYGNSWTLIYPRGSTSASWNYSTAMSDDGKYILVAYGHTQPNLCLSINYGVNWSVLNPTGNLSHTWSLALVSQNGQFMIASGSAGYWYSENYGTNWINNNTAYWFSVLH